jgi:FKBP-type peptidyl-prolyl cis-trans isomerase
MFRSILLASCLLFYFFSHSQSPVIVPASTGYASPAETTEMFQAGGVQNWKDAKQQLSYYFYARQAGDLSIGLNVKNGVAGSVLQVAVAGQKFLVRVPASKTFKSVGAGTVHLADSGFYTITISVLKKSGPVIADIQSVFLSGPPAASLHFNAKPRRNAASVHLKYPLADSVKAISFYNEITVPAGFDPVHTYYMACGFARGYFGIQVNSNTERRVIFSVWDAGKEAADRNKVADSNKVQLLAKGADVFADGFGNEGTGGHSHWVYPWKTGQTYRFIVTAVADSASQTTIYTGFFFVPEVQRWKLIASFRAPFDGKNLRNLYSFNENFDGSNGQLQRKALFSNQWVQRENGSWLELAQASFSYDATGKAGDRIDYGGGTTPDGKFYLWNGGFQRADAAYGDIFKRPATGQRPVVDIAKNADTLVQAMNDQQEIFAAIRAGKLDTTGSKDGVYYQMLKEGTGEQVELTDTVTLFYKGSLLKDGTIFDQTKERPATFPLRRLIRGWQIAVPLCRVGGKIRIIIPSGIAYGIRARSKLIPPNSVLVFDIDVVSTKKLATTGR